MGGGGTKVRHKAASLACFLQFDMFMLYTVICNRQHASMSSVVSDRFVSTQCTFKMTAVYLHSLPYICFTLSRGDSI